ncbi:hypothetical protein [Kitasatospora brasiliensis]|uniref:hypothetical protein n=1 Tax=Kitasatospora brasiliensis TaxID=3058040 RepID=UPI00292E4C9F|nr:hypothetical protein [Kitasatospora sp. K002]
MSAGGWTAETVEVRYIPTAADFREAYATWARHTVAGRRARRGAYVVAACLAVVAGLLALVGGAALVPAGLLLLCALLLVVMPPRAHVRRMVRLVADRGEFLVLLDEHGVVVGNAVSVTEFGWPEQRYYLETGGMFLLLGGNEETGVLTMLPKRGVADVRRLGELIDRHATALVAG